MSDMSISRIEQSLAAERQDLGETLAELRERMSPSALIAEGKAALLARTAPLVDAVDRAVVNRPLTAAAAGLAVAALAFGARFAGSRPHSGPGTARNASTALAGTRQEALSRWEDEGGPTGPEVTSDDDWLDEALSLRSRARSILARIDAAAREGTASLAAAAAYRSAAMQAFARETAAALGRGIEDLSTPAREAAIRQRERIYRARISVADGAVRTVEEYPLISGLTIAAAGAAVGCMFRQTEAEDRILGPLRDELFAEARKGFRAEVTEISDLARSLSQVAKSDLGKVGAAFVLGRRDSEARVRT
jgi:Protein of unknown function (DUF3618)